MTVERALLVRVPGDSAVAALLADIRGAYARAAKALPGDRTDISRYELVSSQLEILAHRAYAAGAATLSIPTSDVDSTAVVESLTDPRLPQVASTAIDEWIRSGDVAVELRRPFNAGSTEHKAAPVPARSPADRWLAPTGVVGKRAVALRFRQQVESVLDGAPGAVVSPGGVSHGVITEVLREYVTRAGRPVQAPIVYRDGSEARPFPLRATQMVEDIPTRLWTELRFALLSIRHIEMDVEVDGAWLRNADISRLRPAGETDELAFELSCRQLGQLCETGPCLIYMYQTGLQPAIVGFYRAVTLHLIKNPNSLAVVPMFFRQPGTESGSHTMFSQGRPWAV
ncbi:hypothetical protein [Flindersiella endophytica]